MEQGPVVREPFDRLARGVPVNKLTEDLNARGVPASTGGAWTRGAVRWVASNEAYIARRTHAGVRHTRAPGRRWCPRPSSGPCSASSPTAGPAPGPARSCTCCPTWPSAASATSHWARTRAGPAGRGILNSCPRGHTAANADSMDYVVALDVVHQLAQPWLTAGSPPPTTARSWPRSRRRRCCGTGWPSTSTRRLPCRTSAAMLAAMEAKLLPRIEAAEQRAVVAAVPVPLRELVAPGDNVDDIGRRWEAVSRPGAADGAEVPDPLDHAGAAGAAGPAWGRDPGRGRGPARHHVGHGLRKAHTCARRPSYA